VVKQQQVKNDLAAKEYNLQQQEYNLKQQEKNQKAEEDAAKKIATNYYNLANQINKIYSTNTTGKNSGDNVIIDDGNGGYMINPNISRSSYLDLVIARALDSNMTDEEVNQFLLGLGISQADISRVASYYLK
jgi:type II secretory pathway pseudopilin PulG